MLEVIVKDIILVVSGGLVDRVMDNFVRVVIILMVLRVIRYSVSV